MIFWGPACVLICLVWLVVHHWWELAEYETPYSRRWLINWAVKGLALPILAWMILNCGTTPVMPPIVKLIVAKPGAFDRFRMFWAQIGPALILISSYWAALTMGWFVVGLTKRMEDRKGFMLSSLVLCTLLSPFVALMVYCYRLSGIGFALLIWLWPIAQFALSQQPMKNRLPTYTRAIAKMKFGKYSEAEAVIIEELEKCETDFAGWMMLAELYSNQFHDLSEAERTICELCDEPETTISQVSIALHRLADWQLKLRGDPVAARRVLEEICKRMPGTHLDKMARLRINQLPANSAELREREKAKTIHMPALSENLHEAADAGALKISPEEALVRANRCVEKLERDPNDVAVREELAGIFAEHLGQVHLAIEQIELLMEMPEQPAAKIEQSLALLASWQIKYCGDEKAARKLLERLVHEHPQSPQAFAAQRQLVLMDMEQRIKRRSNSIGGSTVVVDKPA
jgi:hypothetical protein